jgi:predicted aspartyl protease
MGLVLGLAIATPLAAQDAPKCRLQQLASLPVEFRDNKPLVEVSINGHKTRFLVDTGSTRTLMFTGPAKALGLTPVGTDVLFEGVGGVRAALNVTVGKFGLGETTVSNLRLFVLDGGLGEGVAGVLGEDLLGQTDVEFDLAGGAIRLFDQHDCGRTNLAYWSKTPAIADMDGSGAEYRLPILLNGVTVHGLLDTGAQISVATSGAAARVGGQRKVEAASGTLSGMGAGTAEIATVTFATLKVGDEEIKQAKLKVGDVFRAARVDAPTDSHIKRAMSDDTEVMLGADFLRSHRIYVSTKLRKMFFTYAGGPVFQVVAPVGEAARP